MKSFSSYLLATAIFACSTTFAQDVASEIPTCAENPLANGVALAGCSVNSQACVCENSTLVNEIQTAMANACSGQACKERPNTWIVMSS